MDLLLIDCNTSLVLLYQYSLLYDEVYFILPMDSNYRAGALV